MKNYMLRILRTTLGLFFFAAGSYCVISANVGLGPWEAFHMGVSYHLPLSYGNISVLTGLVIMVIAYFLKEPIGIGTVLNTILIGKFIDLFMYLDILPVMKNFAGGVLLLLLGQFIVALGSYFYISPGLGCGPRDSLMTALSKRLPKAPIGFIRGIIESSALLIGFFLGAKIGIGTIISMFGISFIIQIVFGVLKFDVKTVKHENLAETIRHLNKK
ncbi:MAG: hypothetical protein EOM59_05445 [Clostridia bacterium]|nr:hypothetical protein [Clostridia bacterium]